LRGVLVRVGIDASSGGWNAPVDPESGTFAFVPIPEDEEKVRPGLSRLYDEAVPAVSRFHVQLPERLIGRPMHLDPDFKELTYGDIHPRNIPLLDLVRDDFIAFYAGLRSIQKEDESLIYALIGFFLVDKVVPTVSVPRERWHEYAHTRREPYPGDIVIRARPGPSGLLQRCIPIGEYRDRAYRVRNDILAAWGGLFVKDGYIQRSGRLPAFRDPQRFLDWFGAYKIPVERKNF
jgi:hypothetical protein